DARTGAAGAEFVGSAGTRSLVALGTLPDGKAWSATRLGTVITVWNVATGRSTDSLKLPELPRALEQGRVHPVSPAGRSLVYARRGVFRGGANGPRHDPAPFRLLDTRTNKEVLSFDWPGGSACFTADSGHVLLFEAEGRGRWFKLPSGEPEGEWQFVGPPGGNPFPVPLAMSGDGRGLLCDGPMATNPRSFHFLLDARTGKPTQTLGREFEYANRVGALSTDGRLVGLLRIEGSTGYLVILESEKGAVLGKLKIGD